MRLKRFASREELFYMENFEQQAVPSVKYLSRTPSSLNTLKLPKNDILNN